MYFRNILAHMSEREHVLSDHHGVIPTDAIDGKCLHVLVIQHVVQFRRGYTDAVRMFFWKSDALDPDATGDDLYYRHRYLYDKKKLISVSLIRYFALIHYH